MEHLKNSIMKLLSTLILCSSLFVLISCGNTKNIQILQGSIDPSKIAQINYSTPVIQSGDVLNITIFSDNAVASSLYNQGGSVVGQSAETVANNASGFLVDNNGNIRYYALGNLYVKGLTCDVVAKKIADEMMKANLLKNAYCMVRFANFKFTILGEVNKPSVFNAPNEKISVLEALGLAGDLTSYGRRDSVMVIREFEQSRKIGWIDLRKSDVFNSEYFYLRQNDVLVVHPTRNKAALNDQVIVRNITVGASVISTIAIIISVLKR